MNFKKLDKKNHSYFINSKKPFADTYFLSHENTTKAKEFAKKMTYGKKGEHRNYRSGGSHVRSDREIYSNTLAGKISEFALFEYLNKKEISANQLETGVLETNIQRKIREDNNIPSNIDRHQEKAKRAHTILSYEDWLDFIKEFPWKNPLFTYSLK